MSRFRLVPSLLCAFVVVAAAAPAVAAPLDAARKAYADLSYEACRAEARKALETGPPEHEATLSDRVDTYRLLGLCHAALGDTEEAHDAFVKMLAIDPAAELPAGLSPRFTSSYLEAKGTWVGKKPLDLVVEEERVEGKKRIVRLAVKDDAGLVDKVAWEDDDGERAPGLKAAERMELEVPAELVVKLVGLDRHGGVVVEHALAGPEVAGAAEPPASSAGATSKDASDGEEEPGSGPWLWVGVAAGAGVLLAGGAAAAVAGVMLAPADSVTLESQVVFGNP